MDRRTFLKGSAAIGGLALAGATVGRAAAQATASDAFEEVAAVVVSEMERLGVPGAALGILKDGALTLRGFGVTNIESPQPVDENTIFELASLSKTYTATAVMALVERGMLDLEAPVRTYIPDWQLGTEESAAEMQVKHLVTHSTGINGSAPTRDLGNETLARFGEEMSGLYRIAPPGTIWSYLNPGFALAGRLVEIATGTDIHTAFRQLVFDPLGLTRTSTRLDVIATYRLAIGHQGTGDSLRVIRPYNMGSSIPAGGVNASIADVLRYAAFHINEGDAGAVDVLTPATREAMRVPRISKAPSEDWMCIGWHMRTVGGVPTFAHGGTAGAGHRLLLELVPDRRLAFAVLTNHTDGWRLDQVVEHAILRVYEGLALTPNQPVTYRGINEDFSLHASPLDPQPDPAQYVGSYYRGSNNNLTVTANMGLTMVGNTALNFHGPDVAYSGGSGTPTEFIRNEAGEVMWIRQNGQGFAVKV